MEFKLSMQGLQAMQRNFAQAPALMQRELLAWATDVTAKIETEVVLAYSQPDRAGSTHTGATRRSIDSDVFAKPAGVLGVVGSASLVAKFVELGTRPHFPPLEPLLLWVADKLGKTGPEGEAAARGIQRKIGRLGTVAKPHFARTLQANAAYAVAELEAAVARVTAQLPGPGPAGIVTPGGTA